MAFTPTRREFVKIGAMAGAGLLLARRQAYAAFAQSPSLKMFDQPLRGLGQMAVASPVATGSYAAGSGYPGVDYYEIAAREFCDFLHPTFQAQGKATKLWGYGNKADTTFKHLGGAIVAQRGRPVRIRLFNELPDTHILPVDYTAPGVEESTMALHKRVAIHLHGGHVPWTSDGGPHHWFGAGDTGESREREGASFEAWLPDRSGKPTGDYWYPNDQSARLMWYHDHAQGITRLNAYAGLATAYILRDPAESGLIASGAIPGPAREVPLVFQDKVFKTDGSLWYPSVYDQQFFLLSPGGQPLPPTSLVPEFWGDTVLVNGTVSPYLEVQPRRYRFRILNACNTRFMSLRLLYSVGQAVPDNTDANPNTPGPAMTLIGNEGGFLDGSKTPQGVIIPPGGRLLLAPAERADVIIDFSKVKPGKFLILYNDAPVPFPGGTPLADFHPKNSKLAMPPAPGMTPNTRSVLQFRVVTATDPADSPVPAGWTLPPIEAPNVPTGTIAPPATGVFVRDLTLNEVFDEYGRLAQELGTNIAPDAAFPLSFGREYEAAPTEVVTAGTTEVWRIFNLTADAHPIHFHLANVQVLSRQPFNVKQFAGTPSFTAAPRPPDPDELGWKETVKMYPGECTSVIMTFDLPPDPVVPVGESPTTVPVPQSRRTGGYEYVWHCHILEHEEHDMMRPMIVLPPGTALKP